MKLAYRADEQNMICHLRDPKLSEFRKFIYHAMEVDEFERCWVECKERHGVTEKDLLISLMYELRNKWSTTYTKGRYFLGMQSNQWRESLNSRLHRHLDRKMSLVDLVEHYEFCLSRIHRNEAELDAKASLLVPFPRINADPLEKRAAHIYTPVMFKEVKEQIRKLSEWEVEEVMQQDGFVRYSILLKVNMQDRVHVECYFDDSSLKRATCHCRKKDCEDIPCTHIFTVVRYLGLDIIPRCFVMVRWTMEAKVAFASQRTTNTHVWAVRDLSNKGSLALFKASKSVEESEKVMQFLQSILDEDVDNDGKLEATTFGHLPAHFSGSNQQPSRNDVLDPEHIITKGAPSKRSKQFHESWKGKKTSKNFVLGLE